MKKEYEMDDKKWMDMIERSAENVEVPDSLSPENIRDRLDGQQDGRKKTVPVNRLFLWRKYGVRAAEIAAAVVIVFAAGYQIGSSGRPIAMEETTRQMEDMQQMETAVEPQVYADTETQASADTGKLTETQASADTGKFTETQASADTETAVEPQADAAEEKTEESGTTVVKDAAGKPARKEGLSPVGSEEALYEKLVEYQNTNSNYLMRSETGAGNTSIMMIAQDSAADAGAEVEGEIVQENAFSDAVDGAAGNGASKGDFSQTNLREMGVDEGDIVKTDGEYIYILKQNSSVEIISADGEEMKMIRSLDPEVLSESVRDMYISGDILNIVTGGSRSSMTESGQDVYTTQSYDYAKVLTYDISDPEEPKLQGSVEQEGYYHSSRKVGDYIYLFTEFQPQVKETREESGIMPLINGAPMDAGSIYVPETLESMSYLVVGSVDVTRPSEAVSHKAVVSGADNFYVSPDSIFICNQNWKDDGDVTDILKFSYKDGDIWGVGACAVPGYLNDTFSLDEYDGYLRVVTTEWASSGQTNALYIYDENMELTGRIDDIAQGETIRSARFLGDIGYFVTFRQTDPLFSVDLSDPQNPRILGELKLTGFSSYLHFYGNDRLLGIGYEADTETGATTGVKLSMFDVSDPADVKEIRKYVVKNADYCPGLSNYRAIMINPDKNLFGFVCDNNYLVFTYDEEGGFTNLLTYNLSEGIRQDYYWYAFDEVRGLYISDTFYLADTDVLRSFDMKDDFRQTAKLDF